MIPDIQVAPHTYGVGQRPAARQLTAPQAKNAGMPHAPPRLWALRT
jgi:hypothetical protein